jgi:hypothetical protein
LPSTLQERTVRVFGLLLRLRSYRVHDGLSEVLDLFHSLRLCLNGVVVVLEQPFPLACAFGLLDVNQESLLGPTVPDGYTKLGLVRELNLIGIFLPLRNSFLELIYYGHVGDGRTLLPVPFLALLVLEAFGD